MNSKTKTILKINVQPRLKITILLCFVSIMVDLFDRIWFVILNILSYCKSGIDCSRFRAQEQYG